MDTAARIELAPQHKIGLSLTNPVMIAAGCAGYGLAYQRLIDLTAFGAIVTNPITLRPVRGVAQPRLVETTAGFILNTGGQNPGVKKVIQRYHKSWTRLNVPLIAHLPAGDADDLRRTAQALSSLETAQGDPVIAAIELGVPPTSSPTDIEQWLRAVRAGCPWPLLIKLPLGVPPDLAEAAATAEALVIGAPPLGAALDPLRQQMITGSLYGPALHRLALHDLHRLREFVDLPLIASGGIHTLAEARAFLHAGAVAVQIDSLLFIEPKQAESIARAIQMAD